MELINYLISISTQIYISVITAIILFGVQILYGFLRDAKHSLRFRAYSGVFHLYSSHTCKKTGFIEGRLEVKRVLGKLKAKLTTNNALYKGEVRFTSTNVYLYLTAKKHEEFIQIVFFDPLFPVIKKLWGVGSCISVLGEPCAIRFLMSREKYNEMELTQLFSVGKVIANRNAMRVIRDSSLYIDNAPNINLEEKHT